MKILKINALALALIASNGMFAVNPGITGNKDAAKKEIRDIFKKYAPFLKEESSVPVIFSLNEDRTIMVHSNSCDNKEIKEAIYEKLQGHKLLSTSWEIGRKYILPVKLEIRS